MRITRIFVAACLSLAAGGILAGCSNKDHRIAKDTTKDFDVRWKAVKRLTERKLLADLAKHAGIITRDYRRADRFFQKRCYSLQSYD